jgi:hypothetical protein
VNEQPQAWVRVCRLRAFVAMVVAALALFGLGGWAPHVGALALHTRGPTVSGPTTVTGPGNRAEPDVAFDGTNFFVVWQQKSAASWDI